MWDDPTELVVAGTGEVYVAPVGTALPTSPTAALAAAYTGLGYHTEDGVSISVATEVTEFRSWQSRHPVRRELQAQECQFTFALQQWNDATLPFAFGGGAVSDLGGGVYRYNPPADDAALDERSLIVDVRDGSRRLRFVVPRGNVTDAVQSQFSRSQEAVLPVTFKALVPSDASRSWHVLSDDAAAFASGS
jgi:hypothetical protein